MLNTLHIRQFFALCGELSAGFDPDCDNPLIAGVNDRLILINFDDIAVIATDPLDNNVITDITLKSGKIGFAYNGQNRSVEPQATLVKGRYSNNFDHEVIFKAFGDGPALKEQLNRMVNAKIVAIVENNYRGDGGDAAFSVYGIKGGMEAAELGNPKSDSDSDGAYSVTLRSSEFGREPALPATLFDTDYTTTRAIADGIVDAPVVFNVAPTTVLVAGGTAVQIIGNNFTGATSIDWLLGAVPTNEPGFVVTDDETIDIAASVALSAGTYSVRVTTPSGTGSSLAIVVAA